MLGVFRFILRQNHFILRQLTENKIVDFQIVQVGLSPNGDELRLLRFARNDVLNSVNIPTVKRL